MMLNLVSPIPPAKTGTANYFRLLLSDLKTRIDLSGAKIFVDRSYQAPKSFDDYVVHGIEKLQPSNQDINVFAVANNEFHWYILEFLINKQPSGFNIVLYHDPQIIQNLASLCLSSRKTVAGEAFGDCFATEFSPRFSGQEFAQLIRGGFVTRNLLFTTLGCEKILKSANLVLVHSRYARAKLLLEGPQLLPPIRVVAHPPEEAGSHNRESSRNKAGQFVIGCFGWIGPHKRIDAVIEAFAALCKENARFGQQARLLIPGQLPEKSFFDPVELATKLGVGDRVHFPGFLTHSDLLEAIKSVDVIFNLRYPSCGETSGTLYAGRTSKAEIAVSLYQSFTEESAHHRISIDPRQEQVDIQATMWRCFRDAGKKDKRVNLLTCNQPTTLKRENVAAVIAEYAKCMELIS